MQTKSQKSTNLCHMANDCGQSMGFHSMTAGEIASVIDTRTLRGESTIVWRDRRPALLRGGWKPVVTSNMAAIFDAIKQGC